MERKGRIKKEDGILENIRRADAHFEETLITLLLTLPEPAIGMLAVLG
jgi:hypothetical protein